MGNLSKNIEKLLWDVGQDLTRPHNLILIERILNFGDIEDFSWLLDNFSKDEIVSFIQNTGKKRLNKKSYNFWSKYFGTEYSLGDFTTRTETSVGKDIWY